MPRFSQKSFIKLATCHISLVKLFAEVVKNFDCTILEGRRDQLTQEKYFNEGKSKLHYPDSKHNAEPPNKSIAIDVIPYPIDWQFENDILIPAVAVNYPHNEAIIDMDVVHNIERWAMFGGFVKGVASQMGIEIIWGGDWDSDNQLSNQKFDDWVHFELYGEAKNVK